MKRMKQWLSLALAVCLLASMAVLPAQAAGRFYDVSTRDYFYDGVQWALEEGVTTGTSSTTFSPYATCTRGQIVTFLARAEGAAGASGSNPFTDVTPWDFFYGPVLWAVRENITQGSSPTTFSPYASCTRAQAVTFLWRAAGCPVPQSSRNPFWDVPAGAYYTTAVLWAVEQGITTGTASNTFSPDAVCTRGQIVTFLYRCYQDGLSAQGQVCVYDSNTEGYLRDASGTPDLAALASGEYYSYCMTLKNTGSSPLRVDSAYAVIDGGEKLSWQTFTLQTGASTRLHIYYNGMSAFQKAGTHTVTWYINGEAVLTKTFTFQDTLPPETSRFWQDVFPLPSASAIQAYTNPNNSRSPYLYGWFQLGKSTRFTEYAVDFKADYLPKGTYCCLGQWSMDLSSLEKTHTNVRTEYSGVQGYAGFQSTVTAKGMASILSFWDVYATDPYGQNVTLRAKLVYPEPDGNDSFSGEGTGAHHIRSYPWEASHWYRMLLQCSTDGATGHTLVTQWVCDLETGTWTKLCVYDTLLPDSCFVGNVALFLENYIPSLAGQVRSMEVRNARILNADTGRWQDVEELYMGSNGGAPQYEGSYAFGTRSDRFWMITSGVGGDWYNNGTGQKAGTYQIQNTESGQPYS